MLTSSSSTSWSTKATQTTLHPASLVDPATHSAALMELVELELSRTVIDYFVHYISDTVAYAMRYSGASSSRIHSSLNSPESRQKHTAFVRTVLARAEIATPTILVALSYLARSRPHLAIARETWAFERVFLGALILATKYTDDSTLKNVHWAICSGVFGKRDVGRIEREFLEVLDWELGVKEEELVVHYEGMMPGRAQEKGLSGALPLRIVAAGFEVRSCPVANTPELSPSTSSSSTESNSRTGVGESPRTPAQAMLIQYSVQSSSSFIFK
ncbi:hypothetical protein FB45DRAFT_1148935 [Roridomyces roridus]|uniref:Cyclin N-terminal domain-containing protein n=1 Tax=Roridomyces roridus TaxID=1738132 RepID=A0AAD7BXV0_9AGAR|nr:hypothetical protein FB45DRAFT_1148935 [Roridomyces roridus]